MTVFTHRIDWRSQLTSLENYLDGTGGVVTVRYSDPACAPAAFVQTLTAEYEQGGAPGIYRSIRLDPDNFNTHFLGDIRETFRIKLDAPSEPTTTPQNVRVGSDNHAEGDLHLSVAVNVQGDAAAQARQRSRWADELVTFLTAYLGRGSRLMIILTDDPDNDHAQFWQQLWQGRLQRLTGKGLLVVRMLGPRGVSWSDHPDAPRPDLNLTLPSSLLGSDVLHAIEDATEVLTLEVRGMTSSTAHDMAKAVIYTNSENVQAMRNGIAGLIVKLMSETVA